MKSRAVEEGRRCDDRVEVVDLVGPSRRRVGVNGLAVNKIRRQWSIERAGDLFAQARNHRSILKRSSRRKGSDWMRPTTERIRSIPVKYVHEAGSDKHLGSS